MTWIKMRARRRYLRFASLSTAVGFQASAAE
jgi:hypothetical protein